MGRVVLVTGVAGQLGSETARRLEADPEVDKVVGVDVSPPRGDLGAVRFVRADIRNPVIAKLLAVEDVDTVVHMSVLAVPGRTGGRTSIKETNVVGTMQLLAACQRSDVVRRLVLKSSTTVYGASPRDHGVFTEDTSPQRLPRSGYAKDCSEVEGYVRGFARRRPDVSVTVLRCANVLGPRLETPLGQYLRLPLVPTVLGFDPRLQLLHVDDLFAVLQRAAVSDLPGIFNAAGDDVLTLSQVVRRLGRATVGVPRFGAAALALALERTARLDFSPDQVAFLTYGRVVDTTALREGFGYLPRWSTSRTLADFAATAGTGPLRADRVRRVEQALLAGFAGGRGRRWLRPT